MELFEPGAAVVARDAARRAGRTGACSPIRRTIPGAGGNGDTTGLARRAARRTRARGAVLGLLIDPRVGDAGARRRRRTQRPEFALGEISGVPGHVPLEGEFNVETARRRQLHVHRADVPWVPHGLSGRWRCCAKDGVRVVLASKKCQAADQEMFRHVGIEPRQQRILALKSSVHFRADFEPIAREVLVVAAPRPAKADPTMFSLVAVAAGTAS